MHRTCVLLLLGVEGALVLIYGGHVMMEPNEWAVLSLVRRDV